MAGTPADHRMTAHSPARHGGALLAAGAFTLIVACASPGTEGTATSEPTSATTTIAEQPALSPRLALTYDGGIQVIDATTFELLADLPVSGYTRLNPAGDERHAMLTTAGGFQVLDLGTWAEPHGDHAHYYTSTPRLDIRYEATTPGHVVTHAGRTALFDDGTGTVVVLDAASVAEPGPQVREHTSPTAHHGVAVELTDGTLVITEGDDQTRTGAVAIGSDGSEIARSQECPGVHGEAVADDESVVLGCENGVLVYHEGAFSTIPAPDEYGRIGNLRAVPGSEVVLGDYSTDPDGGSLTQVALIDLHDGEITLVDLGVAYTFRSLARDDEGHALVLAADGAIHVIDPESATVTATVPVLDAWAVPAQWQEPRPTLTSLAGSVYVTDPSEQRLLAVDIPTGEIWQSTVLSVVPDEIVGASGDVADGAHEHEHEHHDH